MIILVAFLIIIFVVSCKKDTGTTDDSNSFNYKSLKGTWKCAETSLLLGKSTYTVTITVNDSTKNPPELYLKNVYQLGSNYVAILKILNSTINIPYQIINNSNATIQGSGLLIPDLPQLKLTYIYTDRSDRDSVNAILTKM
ncbi:MAG: hypothetical protein Q8880_01705 [Bacteroidota bacterium]|nr:hypothetical protein [Bacteroidota bacterium]